MRHLAYALAVALIVLPVAASGHDAGAPGKPEALSSAAEETSSPPPRGQPLSLEQEKQRLDGETHTAYLRYLFTRNREGADSPAAQAARERFEKLDRERRAVLKRMGF